MESDFLGAYRGLLEQLTGRTLGTAPSNAKDYLSKAYEKYGAIKSPSEYNQLLTGENAPTRESLGAEFGQKRLESRQAYQDNLKQLRAAYAERMGGITDPQEREKERQTFLAAKAEAKAPYLADAAYLRVQNRMLRGGATSDIVQKRNERLAAVRERLGQEPVEQKENLAHKRRTERYNQQYERIKDLGRGLDVDMAPARTGINARFSNRPVGLNRAIDLMMNG